MLTNVDLCLIKTNVDVDSDALSQVVPLLTNINKLLFNTDTDTDVVALMQKEYSARMLASARFLYI
jgi:hypothetical protein